LHQLSSISRFYRSVVPIAQGALSVFTGLF
jgi:hypothetical protein